jgi:uncharacterized protein
VDRCRAADAILHAGDLSSAAFLEELEALGPPVGAVLGNADEPSLRARLPEQLVLELDGCRIGMVHVPGPAAGREARLLARFPGCNAIVFGHTHLPVVERFEGVWLLNPGSPTERRRGPFHAMIVVEIEAGEVRPELVRLST